MSGADGPGLRRERGSAVLAAVLVCACVAVLAVQATRTSRSAVAAASAELARARLAAAADAGVAMAVQGLSESDPAVRWAPDGQARTASFEGVDLVLAVEDERGKVPLDTVAPSQAVRLFEAAGADSAAAQTMAAALVALRNPASGGLSSIGAIQALPAMTPELYAKLGPSVTVDAGDAAFDPRYASPLALAAMAGQSDDPAVIERQRELDGERPALDVSTAPSLAGRVVTVRIQASDARGDRLLRAVVVQLTASASVPYVVRRASS